MEDIQIKVELNMAAEEVISTFKVLEVKEVAEIIIISICNQQMKYSETFSVDRIHSLAFSTMMTICSVEVDLETWEVLDKCKWEECMIIWASDKWACKEWDNKWVDKCMVEDTNEIRNLDVKEELRPISRKITEWVEWAWASALMTMTFLVED